MKISTRAENVRLEQIHPPVGCTGLEIFEALLDEPVSETHEISDARLLLGARNHVFAEERALDPVRHRIQSSHNSEGDEAVMEPLDQPPDVLPLGHKAKRCAESYLGYDVVRNIYGPRRKVQGLPWRGKLLVQSTDPVFDLGVDERLHFLDVAEAVWARGYLPEPGVDFGVLHVEEGLILAEAASDVVFRFARIPVVDGGELCRVAD